MSHSGSGANVITEKSPLPDYSRPYVEKYVNKAFDLANPNEKGSYKIDYKEETYAIWDDNEQDGIANLATRARNGDDKVRPAKKGKALVEEIIEGKKLNTNPKLSDLYDKQSDSIIQEFEEETLPAIENEALMLGMFGSSGHHIRQAKEAEKVLTKLINTSENIYYDDYETARDIQENSLGHGIVYGHESTRDWELLRQAGLYEREYEQGKLENTFKIWKAEQEHSVRKLEILGNAIRGLVGSHVTKTEPFYVPSPLSQIAGLALSGAGLVASFYGKTSPNASQYSSSSNTPNAIPSNLTPNSLSNFNPTMLEEK